MADKTPKGEEGESLKKEDRKASKGVCIEDSKIPEEKKVGKDEPISLPREGKRKFDYTEAKKPTPLAAKGITIKLVTDAKKKKAEPIVKKKDTSVAAIFGDESDEEEEIPPEAKMRMRNIGRDTPTSAGPNSFNKGKRGFTHHGKVFEKRLNEKKPP